MNPDGPNLAPNGASFYVHRTMYVKKSSKYLAKTRGCLQGTWTWYTCMIFVRSLYPICLQIAFHNNVLHYAVCVCNMHYIFVQFEIEIRKNLWCCILDHFCDCELTFDLYSPFACFLLPGLFPNIFPLATESPEMALNLQNWPRMLVWFRWCLLSDSFADFNNV